MRFCNEFANFFSQKIQTIRQNIHATQTNKKTNLFLKPRNNSDVMSQFNIFDIKILEKTVFTSVESDLLQIVNSSLASGIFPSH